jgi:putative ABC transport system permease protein
MPNLAFKNLTHDRVRLSVTLTGIVFALVLIIMQFGLFLGFLDTIGAIVDRSKADLWVMGPGVPHVNGGVEIPERRRYQVLAVPGVLRADKWIVVFSPWKLPTGANEMVQIVGYDLDSTMGGPWNVVEGSEDALRAEDTVIVDKLFAERLGATRLGTIAEVSGRRARVVGFTDQIRSFTTAPFTFTSFKNALNYTRIPDDSTQFLLVRVAPGVSVEATRAGIAATVPNVEVMTRAEMRWLTQRYWLFGTGAGISTLLGAALGLLVGMVVVAQTIYATTMDHIREFGTLKAMGAANSYVYRVIIQQAVISASVGYAIAIAMGYLISQKSREGSAVVLLPPEMMAAVLAVALIMCIGASVISIRKATTIDPAMVFRG